MNRVNPTPHDPLPQGDGDDGRCRFDGGHCYREGCDADPDEFGDWWETLDVDTQNTSVKEVPGPSPSLPTDSQARKAVPLFTALFGYFPAALTEVARLCYEANEKHNPGEDMHWARDKSNDHADCLLRHLLDAGTIDPEDGFLHDIKVAWRSLAKAQLALEARGAPKAPLAR